MDRTSLIILVDSVEDTYNSLNKFINEPHNQADWGIKVAQRGSYFELDPNF